ncbi:MAG TPA: hypothetical protein VHM89_08275 [Acidimicrobiales bacterium]|nr:hypothetical protein [Acidimicrobiales bacterium]
MAEADPLRKYVEAGIAFTQLTKAKAESIVRELVKAGDVQREQAQERVEDLLDRSRKSTEGLVGIVRREIAQQLSTMGFATKDDLDGFEARLSSRLAAMVTPQAPGAAGARKTAAGRQAATGPDTKASGTTVKKVPRPAEAPAAPPGTAARKAAAKKGAAPPRRSAAASGEE